MLQRRKRYKNRTILGYKTLAVGSIDMAEVGHKVLMSSERIYVYVLFITSTEKQLRVDNAVSCYIVT